MKRIRHMKQIGIQKKWKKLKDSEGKEKEIERLREKDKQDAENTGIKNEKELQEIKNQETTIESFR